MVSDLFQSVFEWVIPPLDSEPGKQYGWRLRIAIFGTVTFFGLIMVTAYAVSPYGFARHAEVKSIADEVRAERIEQMQGEILKLRILHCGAKTEEAKDLYWSRIVPLLSTYAQLTGQSYPLANCTDL